MGADGASATALQPPPHLLTTLPAPAGGGRRGSPGRGLRGARDQGAGGRATRRWKAMGSDGVRSAELTTHGSGAGLRLEQRWRRCASGLISSPPKGIEPDEVAFQKRGRLGTPRGRGGGARGERVAWADVYDRDPRTGGSRVGPLSAKMAGVQPMGRVRPQASASRYRQQPQKRFSVRF